MIESFEQPREKSAEGELDWRAVHDAERLGFQSALEGNPSPEMLRATQAMALMSEIARNPENDLDV